MARGNLGRRITEVGNRRHCIMIMYVAPSQSIDHRWAVIDWWGQEEEPNLDDCHFVAVALSVIYETVHNRTQMCQRGFPTNSHLKGYMRMFWFLVFLFCVCSNSIFVFVFFFRCKAPNMFTVWDKAKECVLRSVLRPEYLTFGFPATNFPTPHYSILTQEITKDASVSAYWVFG